MAIVTSASTPHPRRARGATESLGSVVLGFESIVVFLGGLVVYGLDALPASLPSWWGIVGGAILALIMVITAARMRSRWAILMGWALQMVLALAGFLVPALALVALIFGGMWGYATIKGASLDRRNAQLAEQSARENSDPNGD